MPVEIPPITAANPVVTPSVSEKVFDTWYLTDFRLVSTPDRKFDAEVFWALGRPYTQDREVTTEETTTENVVDENGNPVMEPQINPETGEIVYQTDPETGLPTENPVLVQKTQTVTNTVTTTVTDTLAEFSSKRSTAYVRDILSDEFLVNNPEIAAILPGFLGAITAVSMRQGAI